MAKWHGIVGYVESIEKEDQPGVWVEEITERTYFGDLIENNRRLESYDKVNSDINISNNISIVADPYAYQNFHKLRYVEFMGANWNITVAKVQYPRIILTLGGLYNGA